MGELIQLYGFIEQPDGVKGEEFGSEKPEAGETSRLFFISYQDVACLARRVPEEEFGEGALQERMKDAQWLKDELMRQEEALERVMTTCTVIPLKWGAIFRTEESVGALLKEQYETIRELLKKLKGREEWTVRALVDRGRLQEAAARKDPEIQRLKAAIEKMPPGTAYLLTERLKLLSEEAGQRTVDEMTQGFYTQLMLHAEASATAEPVRSGDPETEELVFQMAFLVPKENLSGFTQAVGQAARQWQPLGFKIQQVGPFPPYYFCHLDLKGCEAHGPTT